MRNPDQTKAKILSKSGVLFNTRGYKATSISDITGATGFTKGAIYRHFKNKDMLEKETLAHLSEITFAKLRDRIKAADTAIAKLKSVFRFFEAYLHNTADVKGGCPVMNAAIEADDAHPMLRKEALKMLDLLRDSIIHILKNGIKYKQIKKNIDLEFYATLIVASLEGAIMMSRLRQNHDDIRRVVLHLEKQLDEITI